MLSRINSAAIIELDAISVNTSRTIAIFDTSLIIKATHIARALQYHPKTDSFI